MKKNQPDPIKLNKMIKHDAFEFEKTRCRFYSIEFSTVETLVFGAAKYGHFRVKDINI